MRRKKLIVLLLFLVTVLSINVNAKEEYNKSILSFESKTEEIESGKDIHYLINFKVSGNKETYQNYRLNILLPKKEYINFNQNINELMIDNQKPVYDVKNNMLKWNFKTLKSGNSYKLVLKVNTKNSIIPDGSELVSKATLLNTNKIEKEESAKTKLKSTGKLAVSNKFSEVLDSDFIVPAQGKQGIWDFSVSVPKSEFGDKSIKENSQITVSYLLQEGVEYKNVVSGSDMPTEVTKNPDGTTIIEWKYTADSFKNQNANKNDFFSKKYQIITHFKQEIPQFTNVNTVGKIETTFFDMNSTSTKEENATVFVLSSEPRPIDTDGNVWVSSGYGPKDGKGDVTYEILDPVVYDGDLLGYGIGIAPGFATHPSKGFSDYETYYSVDDHLYLAHWYTGSFSYCPDVTYECIPPKNKIKYDVYVKYGFKDNMDENYSLFLKDVEPEEIYYGV
ncbi:MAG: hypothetical protein RR425_05775, partial [Erysipelotrichales bacterium]